MGTVHRCIRSTDIVIWHDCVMSWCTFVHDAGSPGTFCCGCVRWQEDSRAKPL